MGVCHLCGKESYVMYLKLNPGTICPECEDKEREKKGKADPWKEVCERMGYKYRGGDK